MKHPNTLAWHWTNSTLRNGDPVPPDGETLVHDGSVKMCESGLHASRRVLDALRYAPGSTVCRVEMGGIVEEQEDKLVARERTILWRMDAEDLLRDFARRCALDVIDLWDAPDVVREYLETGDESLRDAAGYAAWDAAWDAAWAAAAWDAAWAAARAAAWAVAWDVAWAAARAAGAAARAAARDAVREEQNQHLTTMIQDAR